MARICVVCGRERRKGELQTRKKRLGGGRACKDGCVRKSGWQKPPRHAPITDWRATLEERAERMRCVPTPAEKLFRDRLWREAQERGWLVVNQQPFMTWIFDFYIKTLGVFIELDGGYHNTKEQRAKDQKKTRAAMEKGFVVVRLKNEEAHTFDFSTLRAAQKVSEAVQWLERWLNKEKKPKKATIQRCITPVSEQKPRLVKQSRQIPDDLLRFWFATDGI